MPVIGGTDLFRLAETKDASAIYQRLSRAGILVRAFDYNPDWLRFGLPPDEAALRRLSETLCVSGSAAP